MARRPVVAGAFYEADRESLVKGIEECFLGSLGPGRLPAVSNARIGKIAGLVCPHAGYVYSGSAAAFSYDALAADGIPETIVLLGPNHGGIGASVALSPDDEWQTPLGSVQIDAETTNAILAGCEYARLDAAPHTREHSIEVQLPFLQYIGDTRFKIVPISLAHFGEHDALLLAEELGAALAKALSGKSAVIIASSDFSHYESQERAHARDSLAIEQILKLDGPELIGTVYGRSITMCGVIGTAVMLEACKALGAATARKLAYYTSGDVTGDYSQVVGYGALSVGTD